MVPPPFKKRRFSGERSLGVRFRGRVPSIFEKSGRRRGHRGTSPSRVRASRLPWAVLAGSPAHGLLGAECFRAAADVKRTPRASHLAQAAARSVIATVAEIASALRHRERDHGASRKKGVFGSVSCNSGVKSRRARARGRRTDPGLVPGCNRMPRRPTEGTCRTARPRRSRPCSRRKRDVPAAAEICGAGQRPELRRSIERPIGTSRSSGRTFARELEWAKPWKKVLDVEAAPRRVVRRREAQRLGQLPRPPPATGRVATRRLSSGKASRAISAS